MKQWRLAWGVVLLLAVLMILGHSRSQALLEDTDTHFLLTKMAERASPLSWFGGDWPLGNHFYRPVVTLVFELDYALAGWQSGHYAITNAVLAALSVVALFWFLRELLDEALPAAASAAVYAVWTMRWPLDTLLVYMAWLLALVGLVGALLPGRNRSLLIGPLALGTWVAWESPALAAVNGGIVNWVPGRTASTMAVFCFAALAAYARWLRLFSTEKPRTYGPLDPPATKNTRLESPRAWEKLWGPVSLLGVFLALGSYEQAVMLPACFVGVTILFAMQGRKPKWWLAGGSWLILGAYLALRWLVLPHTVSRYQDQQFRSGPDVYYSILDYLYPPARMEGKWATMAELGPFAYVNEVGNFLVVIGITTGLILAIRAIKKPNPAQPKWLAPALLGGVLLSATAFLPMAWMKPFAMYNHYHFWPLGFRAMVTVGAFGLLIRSVISAWSLPELPAPQRPSPAPGSLPRR